MNALHQEWLALQSQHERYEALSLGVKLAAFAVVVLAPDPRLTLPLLGLLWLQEGVLKTFQARLGDRLLAIEPAIKSDEAAAAMQLHSDWAARRPRGGALVAQYLKSALRPTVALPYPVLMALVMALSA